MNAGNLKRAVEIDGEIQETKRALEQAISLRDSGISFTLQEHSDLSGEHVDIVYQAGNCPAFYTEIAEFTVTKLRKHLNDLLEEVSRL